MGQSKWRKENDPNYGKPKPIKHGLIVSPPMTIDGTRLYARSASLDPQELRFSLLFWDRFVWPSSRNIFFGGGPDEAFLQKIGIIERPDYTFDGDAASGILAGYLRAFFDLNEREPGAWCLAQGENSLLLQNNQFYDQRGTLVELHRAIPVPDKDVPLAEILEFKQRRSDEFGLLKQQIENLYQQSTGLPDRELALRHAISNIEKACVDAIRVSKEWSFPVRLTDLKQNFEWEPIKLVAGATAGWAVSGALPELDAVIATAVGATVSGVKWKISHGLGFKSKYERMGPYRYVAQFHKEIF